MNGIYFTNCSNTRMDWKSIKKKKHQQNKTENIVDSIGREAWFHQTFTFVHWMYKMFFPTPWVTGEVLKLHSNGITWKSPPRLGVALVSQAHRNTVSNHSFTKHQPHNDVTSRVWKAACTSPLASSGSCDSYKIKYMGPLVWTELLP